MDTLMLIVVQNFGPPPIASALQHLQDRLQARNPGFRVFVGDTELGSLRFKGAVLAAHGQNHGPQRLDIIGKCGCGVRHDRI